MKETRTINLGGLVFNIDNDAYLALSNYLQDIELRLSSEERAEVMADIEARISELLQKALFARNVQVVDITMIDAVQAQMGAPSEFGENKRPKVKHTAQAERNGCSRALKVSLITILVICAVPLIIPMIATVFALLMAFFGVSLGLGAAALPVVGIFGGSIGWAILLVIAALAVVIVPIVMIIHSIVTYMRTRKSPNARFWIITLTIWVLSLVATGVLTNRAAHDMGGFKSLWNQVAMMVDDDDDDQSEARTVADFESVEVQGDVEVNITTGTDYSLLVSSNRLPYVTTEVRDSVLYISVPDDRYTEAEISLMMPTLKSVRGIGDCEIRANVNVDSLQASIDGAGQLNLEGTAGYVDLRVAGASKAEAEWLNARVMHVNCIGASKAELYVEKELWAQALGASKITYKGNPVVKQSMAVGGSAIRKEY